MNTYLSPLDVYDFCLHQRAVFQAFLSVTAQSVQIRNTLLKNKPLRFQCRSIWAGTTLTPHALVKRSTLIPRILYTSGGSDTLTSDPRSPQTNNGFSTLTTDSRTPYTNLVHQHLADLVHQHSEMADPMLCAASANFRRVWDYVLRKSCRVFPSLLLFFSLLGGSFLRPFLLYRCRARAAAAAPARTRIPRFLCLISGYVKLYEAARAPSRGFFFFSEIANRESCSRKFEN